MHLFTALASLQRAFYCITHDSLFFPGDIPSGCKLIRNRSDCKDIDWTTYTCVLGFQVFGKHSLTNFKATNTASVVLFASICH